MRRSSCVDLPFGFRWSVVADMRYFQLSQKATAMQHPFELLETKGNTAVNAAVTAGDHRDMPAQVERVAK